LLNRLGLKQPAELIPAVYQVAADRAAIAALAEVVIETADKGDPVAHEIIRQAAEELAAMVAAVAEKLRFAESGFPLALSGGALLGSRELNAGLRAQLAARGLRAGPLADVVDPVRGAVLLAQQAALGE
jgi:N-acetylglucosamine kinase-like BadF-type ATPase